MVSSFDEAEKLCSEDGGRLYQPRVVKSWIAVRNAEYEILNHFHLWTNSQHSYVAIGIQITYEGSKANFHYNDGTQVDPIIMQQFNWETGHPSGNAQDVCVAIQNLRLVSVPCSGYSNSECKKAHQDSTQTYFLLIGTQNLEENFLAFICETRSMEVVGSQNMGQTCHFPFIFNNKTYFSCTSDSNPLLGEHVQFLNQFNQKKIWLYCTIMVC